VLWPWPVTRIRISSRSPPSPQVARPCHGFHHRLLLRDAAWASAEVWLRWDPRAMSRCDVPVRCPGASCAESFITASL
jgi:hypothetical protein